MTHPTPERVAIYARVSTGMRVEDGFSIAAQLVEMREFAAARGWEVVAEFVDAGITGQTLDRPNLTALIAGVEDGAFDIVVVHELSRLSRSSVFDTFSIFDILGKHNIGFASVKEPQFDLATPTGRLFLTFIAGINQYYVDILRLHTKKAKRQRAREGLYNASIAPYGYRHTGDAKTPPVIVEEEAKAVRMAFERYATGQYSYQEIADLLNKAGFRTRAGRRFSKDTVADVIRNRFYTGVVVYKEGSRGGDVGETYPGLHEPIISEELWNAALRIRQRHHHASRTFQRQLRPYLLSRIGHCHICGRKLRAQSAAAASYYREMSYSRGYDDCPNAQIGVRADKLHRQISAIVREIRLPPDWREELIQIIGEGDEVSTLQSRRARLVARRRRLKEGYLQGDFEEDVDIYRRELEQVRQAIAQLPSEDDLGQIQQAADILDSLSDVWDEADLADQRDLIRLMLQKVQVDVVQGRLLLLHPTAPFIPLFRSISLLQERGLGAFTPIWSEEIAQLPKSEMLPYPALPSLSELPAENQLADLPFLPTWPWPPQPKIRISQPLSVTLKARRQAGYEGGVAVAVPQPGIPSVLLDNRKWPDVSLKTLSLPQALEQADGSVVFLGTPLVVQRHSDRDNLAQAVFRILKPEGHWHLIDIVPASMPAHWIFAFFPDAWAYAQGSFWTSYNFYNVLRRAGFQVKQEEHTFYRSVTFGVVLEIARQRPGLLATLPDELYEMGLGRLEKMVEEQGADGLLPSEVTLVEVVAVKKTEKAKEAKR
ncbi:MAG: hypothetical protein DRJ03_24745 [Chloroflexi bacterium]|nr:MAG: hypothetical protein DRJ03_24745 [Chloroflexota bacterium]